MSSEKVYLSLGSNLGNTEAHLLEALVALNARGLHVLQVSGLYLTEPLGYKDQPEFLNMVALAQTELSPEAVLEICQGIEKDRGRVRDIRWGPRPLDIDILFFGERKIKEKTLIIPHPRLTERAFVLVPLHEVDPELFRLKQLAIPEQKVVLQTTGADVKIKLHKLGLVLKN